MDTNIAISVKNLTKIYHLYDNPQDRLKEALSPFRKSYHHDFYAMNDVSFEIKKGETVGIIGKNGAGKSTLLKMITGVLTPTSGSVEVNGKIASLLELGAGFNPEMSGLENIYLNGTLMGFTKEEMDTKVDAILEFADIGEFIYQQTKTYSSGMFARLAFSVSINVEPDILIVDEALSVGDIRFQQKCIRKMKEFKEKGMTILFVSHDVGIINDFCSKAIWLKDAKIFQYGKSSMVTKDYFSYMAYGEIGKRKKEVEESENQKDLIGKPNFMLENLDNYQSFGQKDIKIQAASFINSYDKKSVSKLYGGEKVSVIFSVVAEKEISKPIIGIEFKNKKGNIIFGINNIIYQRELNLLPKNHLVYYEISFLFPLLSLGEYSVNIAIAEGNLASHIQQHWIHDVFFFIVEPDINKRINSIFFLKDDDVNFQENI